MSSCFLFSCGRLQLLFYLCLFCHLVHVPFRYVSVFCILVVCFHLVCIMYVVLFVLFMFLGFGPFTFAVFCRGNSNWFDFLPTQFDLSQDQIEFDSDFDSRLDLILGESI